MNNRKTMIFKETTNLPTSSSKTSFKGSSSTLNLNSTVLGSSESLCNLSSVQNQSQLDELELKIAYNRYLQSCLKEVIINTTVKHHETVLEDQLSIFRDKAGKYRLEEHALQEEINAIETQKLIASKINELRADVEEVKQALTPQVRKKVDLLVNLVEELGNKLYLKDMEPLVGQASFDEVEIVFANISKNIKQLMANAGCCSGLKELKNAIVSLRDKQAELVVQCKNLRDMEHSVAALTLKTLSDLFST